MEKTQPGRLEIRILDRGPQIIEGHFTLIGPGEKPAEFTPPSNNESPTLRSAAAENPENNPFCDDSHAKPQPHNPFLK